MRLRTLSIIFMALACINSSYAGIAQLSSSTAKSATYIIQIKSYGLSSLKILTLLMVGENITGRL